MRADRDPALPSAIRASVSLAPGGAVAAGQKHRLDAGRLGERRDGRKMLAGEKLGRRHQRGLAAGLDHIRHGDQRDDRLAGADVALEKPQHALLAGKIALDLGERLTLRGGELEGEGGFDPSRAACRPPSTPCRARGSCCRARSRARAGSRRARRRRAAAMPGLPGRSPRPLPADARRAAPARKPASRAPRGGPATAIPEARAGAPAPAPIARRSTFGESPAVMPVDRLDRRHLLGALDRQHVVRVADLRAHVEPFDVAADDQPRAERKELLQPVRLRLEIDDLDRRLAVGEDDAPGRIAAARLLDPLHHAFDRDRAGRRHLVERRAVAAVDEPARQVEEQIADERLVALRADRPRDQRADARADARQRRSPARRADRGGKGACRSSCCNLQD